jgi:hypothetical protein
MDSRQLALIAERTGPRNLEMKLTTLIRKAFDAIDDIPQAEANAMGGAAGQEEARQNQIKKASGYLRQAMRVYASAARGRWQRLLRQAGHGSV